MLGGYNKALKSNHELTGM